MKTLRYLRCFAFVLLCLNIVRADDFPGLKVIMTADDYARAGLERLTSDQIGVIDAALIRHFKASVMVAAERKAADEARQKADIAANCDLARQNQRMLDDGVRMANVDKNGERGIMGDQERAEFGKKNQKVLAGCQ